MKKGTLQLVIVLVLLTVLVLVGMAQESHRDTPMTTDDPNWSALMGSMEHMHIAMAAVV